jgi:tetratricopeptide (TPR) repeat protein
VLSERPTSIFISYSHDSAEHLARVLALAQRLGQGGFHCILDQYETSPPEGWLLWMERNLDEADFVLLICTESYHRRVMGREVAGVGHGARWEGNLIYQSLYNAGTINTRFVPVLLGGAQFENIPRPLQGATFFLAEQEDGYADLKRRLQGLAPALRPIPGRSASPIWMVPFNRNPFFCGRESTLALLQARFSGPRAHDVQALCGMGGVGKSQIAAEFAHRAREHYDAVLWTAADRESLSLGYSRIAEVLGLPSGRDRDQSRVVEEVTQWLKSSTRWLLVLDNVEEPDQLSEFLPKVVRGHILLTSRLRRLDRLAADPISVTEMNGEDAVGFLLARTEREVSTEERAAAATLVTDLGCLPLALEQAGAYMLATQTRFDEYLDAYREERLAFLETASPVQGGYHASVATTWRMNFREIERHPQSAELLYLSSLLHPDNIPLDLVSAAAEFTPSSIATLQRKHGVALNELLEPLTRYSLIRRDLSLRTYSIHRLVQSVLREELGEEKLAVWMSRVVRIVRHAFPTPDALYSRWLNCDLLIPQVQACLAHLPSAPAQGIALLSDAGFYLTERGQYAAAEVLLERALAAAEGIAAAEPLTLAHALDWRGWLAFKQGHFDAAERNYLRALEVRARALGSEHIELTEVWNNLALLYDQQMRWREAEALYQKALAIRKKALGNDDRSVGISLMNLAVLYERERRYGEAADCGQQAQSILEHHMGGSHPIVATNLDNMGWVHYRMQRYAEALPLFQRALEIREQTLGPVHPEVARSLTNLAILRWDTGHRDIEPLFQRALEIRQTCLPPDHPDLARSWSNLGELYANLDRPEEAESRLQRALAIYERAFGPEHRALLEVLPCYAAVLRKLGQPAEAVEARAQRIRDLPATGAGMPAAPDNAVPTASS